MKKEIEKAINELATRASGCTPTASEQIGKAVLALAQAHQIIRSGGYDGEKETPTNKT